MDGEKPIAKLTQLSRQTEPAKGILGKLKNFLTGSDSGIISSGKDHALSAPVALGMHILLKELTDASVG